VLVIYMWCKLVAPKKLQSEVTNYNTNLLPPQKTACGCGRLQIFTLWESLELVGLIVLQLIMKPCKVWFFSVFKVWLYSVFSLCRQVPWSIRWYELAVFSQPL